MLKTFTKLLSYLVFSLFFSQPLFSADINILADRMEVFEEEGVVVFTGKVHAHQRDMQIWSDKLIVNYVKSPTGREMQRAIALGRVKIEKGKWKATAGKGTYFKAEERLVLEDQAKVWFEDHLVEGDMVILYFNEDRSEVISKGGRVRAVIKR